jgi:hypothetical protein
MKFGQLFAQTTASTPASVKDQVRTTRAWKRWNETATTRFSMRIFLYILSGFDELLFEETRVDPLGGSGFLVGIERILRDDER